ncbi:pirin family protein [Paraburkholderia sp.]|uniref:pirin family protein n=1 Tax=Paraburkholderia sp. TaxID=1926495 RepID=UPI00238F2258|nr:pirin family protein [Paraburkholderia sp.]MDE1179985.1 pirin family protein [Paraburkholderia sp.]
MTHRTLKTVHRAYRDDIADLVTRRPLPGPALPDLNPFLFLNHHGPQVYPPRNHGLPFGPHPHRGFETVTFVLEGSLAHSDTGGHESVIDAGGMQWMTAGSGLIHAELSPKSFMERGGALEILQLWLNLPAKLKMTKPRYIGLQAPELPVVDAAGSGAQVQLIAGEWQGVGGPVESLTNALMSVVRIPAGDRVQFDGLNGRVVFLYVVRGGISIGGAQVAQWQLAELHDDGDTLELNADEASVVLFGHADPIHEPIAARGPFVMNTQVELNQAVVDFHAGKFNVAPE